MKTYYDETSGREIVRLTEEAIDDCGRGGGSKDEAVAYHVTRVEWIATDDDLRAMLREYGAWDDLTLADTELLRSRALWCAACDKGNV